MRFCDIHKVHAADPMTTRVSWTLEIIPLSFSKCQRCIETLGRENKTKKKKKRQHKQKQKQHETIKYLESLTSQVDMIVSVPGVSKGAHHSPSQ